MSQRQRQIIEILAPAPLAAIMIAIATPASQSLAVATGGFASLVFIAYLFALVPSLIYSLVMEKWFALRLDKKYGRVSTAMLSLTLGSVSGGGIWCLGAMLGFITRVDAPPLLLVGSLVGLIIGGFLTCKGGDKR
jgi:hypothetical protein